MSSSAQTPKVPEPIHGSCLCGAFRYQLRGGLGKPVICYCSSCQMTSGGFFEADSVVDEKVCSDVSQLYPFRSFPPPGLPSNSSFCSTPTLDGPIELHDRSLRRPCRGYQRVHPLHRQRGPRVSLFLLGMRMYRLHEERRACAGDGDCGGRNDEGRSGGVVEAGNGAVLRT